MCKKCAKLVVFRTLIWETQVSQSQGSIPVFYSDIQKIPAWHPRIKGNQDKGRFFDAIFYPLMKLTWEGVLESRCGLTL
jgi:hypothetical protein